MSKPKCPGQDMRFWRPEDIFDIRCPHCGHDIEFFKDEPVLTCRSCGKDVRNPRVDLSCAKWCRFAEQCLGTMPDETESVGSLCERLISRMESHFGADRRRIDHAKKVLARAEAVMAHRRGVSGLVVRAAAILHDVGIPEAQRKYGGTAGKYQEIEGPPIARKIMSDLDMAPEIVDHVCRIIANHHSAADIDTPEFRIVWDADWLVNIAADYNTADKARTAELIEKVFKTSCGKRMAENLFLERDQS